MQMDGTSIITESVHWSVGNAPIALVFACICFIVGMLTKTCGRYAKISAEVPVILFFLGLLGGAMATKYNSMKPYIALLTEKPRQILPIVLPAIVFGIAYHMDTRAFFRNLWQILIIVIAGNAMFVTLVSTLLKYFCHGTPWPHCMAIAAACSCTAPLPVISSLNDMGRSKGLVALLQGEWLGTIVIALFVIQVSDWPLETHAFIDSTDCFTAVGQLVLGPLSGCISGLLTICLLPSFFRDVATSMMLTLVSTYATFYFAEEVCVSSGAFAVMILGLMVSYKRPAMEPYDDVALLQFWKLLGLLVETCVYLIVGGLCVIKAPDVVHLDDFFTVLLLYTACFIARLCTLSAALPLLTRVGYGISWPEFLLLIWGSLRGTSTLLLALFASGKVAAESGEGIHLMHVAGFVLFTILANGVTIPLLLQFVGYVGPSPMRLIDLQATHCDLSMVRKRKIRDMQMDNALPDAAWAVVPEMAKVSESVVVHHQASTQHRSSCVGWLRDNRSEVVRKEAVLRLLRLKKVGYWRQYACGMLSTRALRLLLAAVYLAAERCKTEVLLAEIKSAWSMGRVLPALRKRLVVLIAILRPTMAAPPTHDRVRTRAFSLAISTLLARAMLMILMLNFCTTMYQILRNPCPKFRGVYWMMQTIDLLLYLCLVGEFAIKVTAFGPYQIFHGPLNALLIAVMLTASSGKIIDVLDMMTIVSLCKAKTTSMGLYMSYMILEILRLVLLVRVLLESVPFILTMLDHVLDSRLIFGFEVATSFVAVQQEVLRILPVLRISKNMKRDLRIKEQRDRFTVSRDLGILQSERPTLSTQVQTGQALRCVFRTQNACVRGLTDRGLLDYTSRDRILTYITQKHKLCNSQLKELGPRTPLDVLLHLPWLEGDSLSRTMVLEHMRPASFQFEEEVLSVGKPADGMYVVLSGMIHLSYQPTEAVTNALARRGLLPSMDYFGALNFDDKLEDYILAGRVLGEVAALTGRCHDARAVAATAVQAFWLPQTLINSLIKSNAKIRDSLWLGVGSRVAQELLGQLPSYERCGSKLAKARVEILSETERSVTFNDNEDVVLVQGVALDVGRGSFLIAPTLVPRMTRYLELALREDLGIDVDPDESEDVREAVLLAVPLRSLDIDILSTNECRNVTWRLRSMDPVP